MLPGAGIAAEGFGLPAIALVHCPYPLPVRGAPPMFTGLTNLHPMPGRLGALRDTALSSALQIGLNMGVPLLNKARAERAWGRCDARSSSCSALMRSA